MDVETNSTQKLMDTEKIQVEERTNGFLFAMVVLVLSILLLFIGAANYNTGMMTIGIMGVVISAMVGVVIKAKKQE